MPRIDLSLARFAAEPVRRDRWTAIDELCERSTPEMRAWEAEHAPMDDGSFCFSGDYAAIGDHLSAHPWIRSVTDIGCCWGVQRIYLPQDVEYIGVDASAPMGFNPHLPDRWDHPVRIPFFREGEGRYFVARFPDCITPEMRGDAFISNMAVGYGPRATLDEEVAGFVAFPCGYFRGPKDLAAMLSEAFPHREIVRESLSWVSEPMYFFSATGDTE